jgi:aspartyl-tRNA(Asn)/glutamyl-tRNA(Gln) amidotransferase subunit B
MHDVSDADMEKGQMRLEPNISLSPDPDKLPDYKVEVKNINSFRFVEQAINFEVKRQTELLEKNERPAQETRGWDSVKNKTFSQRSKEDAQDYRYFPEPDIPPIVTSKEQIAKLQSDMPELPDAKLERFIKEYTLPKYDAEILTRERQLADYFETAVKDGEKEKVNAKQIANWIINKKINIDEVMPASVIKQILEATKTETIDDAELEEVISAVITEQAQAVADYKNGKEASLMFLLGQTMRKLGKKVDEQMVKEKIKSQLT